MPGYSTTVSGTLPQGTQVFNGVSMAPTVAAPVESVTQVLGGFGPGPGTTGFPKVYSGAAFVQKPLKVWSGAAWAQKPVKVWTGSVWKTLT